MNISESQSAGSELLFVGFNQDQGCFACGLEDGFRVLNCDPLKQKERFDFRQGGIGQVEMLFRCNYMALVGGGKQPAFPRNKVEIWDDFRKCVAIELDFATDVKAVRLRRDRIVVVLESLIKVYTFMQKPEQLHEFDTELNSQAMCCLCPSSQNSLLAFPGRSSPGLVVLVDLAEPDKRSTAIQAHNSRLACLSLNTDGWQPVTGDNKQAANCCILLGTKLATASEKGTIVRVFDTATGDKLRELRRGSQPAVIYSINFSRDSSLLCTTSNHGTVHIFHLVGQATKNSRFSFVFIVCIYLSSVFFRSGPLSVRYLPGEVSFSRFQLPMTARKQSVPCICAFGNDPGSVIVVSADGSYYKFSFDVEKGECTRQTYSLFLEMAN